MPKELNLFWGNEITLIPLLINLIIGVILSLILGWHYRRYGSTLSNREEFSKIFPLILTTTLLIIAIVKSSLALSLGLVGALSIVRFRTPVKEPEELAYLFLTIAIGLGLGAGQTGPTIASVILIFVVIALVRKKGKNNRNKLVYLTVDWKYSGGNRPGNIIERIIDIVVSHVETADVRRFDDREDGVEINFLLPVQDFKVVDSLISGLRSDLGNVNVCFLDQNRIPPM